MTSTVLKTLIQSTYSRKEVCWSCLQQYLRREDWSLAENVKITVEDPKLNTGWLVFKMENH